MIRRKSFAYGNTVLTNKHLLMYAFGPFFIWIAIFLAAGPFSLWLTFLTIQYGANGYIGVIQLYFAIWIIAKIGYLSVDEKNGLIEANPMFISLFKMIIFICFLNSLFSGFVNVVTGNWNWIFM